MQAAHVPRNVNPSIAGYGNRLSGGQARALTLDPVIDHEPGIRESLLIGLEPIAGSDGLANRGGALGQIAKESRVGLDLPIAIGHDRPLSSQLSYSRGLGIRRPV